MLERQKFTYYYQDPRVENSKRVSELLKKFSVVKTKKAQPEDITWFKRSVDKNRDHMKDAIKLLKTGKFYFISREHWPWKDNSFEYTSVTSRWSTPKRGHSYHEHLEVNFVKHKDSYGYMLQWKGGE